MALALARGAVEAGEHEAALGRALGEELLGAVHGEGAVVVEGDHIGGVQERQAQVLGHEARGEVLAAGDELLGGELALAGAVGEVGKLLADGVGEAQLVGDVEVALADVREQVVAAHVVAHMRVYQVEQVGDLGILFKAASAGRDHHKAAGGVRLDDATDFAEVVGVGDGGAAELCDLYHVGAVTFLGCCDSLGAL